MNATVQRIAELVKAEDMAFVNTLDDDTYEFHVGPYVDKTEDAIDAMSRALGISFDDALLIVIATVIGRRK